MSTPATRTLALGEVPILGLANTQQPAVLAMHGWGRNAKDFAFLLESDIPTVSIDLPGFGGTTLPSSEWGTSDYADAVAAALRTRGWSDLVLVGHSFGGRVAAHMAVRHPELVRGIVFTGAPLIRPESGPARKPPLVFRVARALNKLGIVPDSVMEKQRQKHGSADYRAAGPTLRPVLVRAVNETYDEQLDGIAARALPVALVWGDQDTAAPYQQVAQLRERLSPLVVHEGAGKGHFTVHEMTSEIIDATRAVLDAGGARP